MKRIAVAAMVCVVAAAVAASASGGAKTGASTGSAKATINIGVFLASSANTYWAAELQGAKDAAKKAGSGTRSKRPSVRGGG